MFTVPPAKDAANRAKHGISLWRMLDMDPRGSIARHVIRNGEARTVTLARIDGRLYVAVTTVRGEDVRAISLRLASRKERRGFEAGQ